MERIFRIQPKGEVQKDPQGYVVCGEEYKRKVERTLPGRFSFIPEPFTPREMIAEVFKWSGTRADARKRKEQ